MAQYGFVFYQTSSLTAVNNGTGGAGSLGRLFDSPFGLVQQNLDNPPNGQPYSFTYNGTPPTALKITDGSAKDEGILDGLPNDDPEGDADQVLSEAFLGKPAGTEVMALYQYVVRPVGGPADGSQDITVTFVELSTDTMSQAPAGVVVNKPFATGVTYEVVRLPFSSGPSGNQPPSTPYSTFLAANDGWVDGTSGNDSIDGAYLEPVVGGIDKVDNNDATLPGRTGNDDNIRSGAGDDTVRAGLGNDSVFGGTGNDFLYGDDGDDTLLGEADNDQIFGDIGNDSLDGGTGNDVISGGDDNDTIFGGDDNDSLSGDAGNDSIFGGAGNDTISGGDGNDTLSGDAGDDTLLGGADNDTIFGGAGNDYVEGNGGADYIEGGDGDDILFGDTGGNDGNDTIYGGAGNDRLELDGGDDSAFGGADNDVIFGYEGNDTISGDAGDDELWGDEGNDVISGGDDNDTLDGGGGGSDTLTGGDGNDTFIISGGAGDTITITDFGFGETDGANGSSADNDYMDLSQWYNDTTLAQYNALNGTQHKSPLDALREDAQDGVLDFIAAQGGPTVNVTYTNISVMNTEHTGVTCFARGTLIETIRGAIAVEDLTKGDLVRTLDNGYQPIRWIGSRRIAATELEASPNLRPIRIKAGALGSGLPQRDLVVSPQHRIMLASDLAQKLMGEYTMLTAAKQLLAVDGIDIAEDLAEVEYFHVMFDQHQIILSEDAPTESFYTGEMALSMLGAEAKDELFTLFPQLRDVSKAQPPVPARLMLNGREGRRLAAQHVKHKIDLVSDFGDVIAPTAPLRSGSGKCSVSNPSPPHMQRSRASKWRT